MLISISILVTICLICSILAIFQTKKNQQRNLALFNELNQQINSLKQTLPNRINEWSTALEKVTDEHFVQMITSQIETQEKIKNQITKELVSTKNQISKELKNELHTYIHYDDEQQLEWTQLISNQTNQRTKLQYLESALNKFPNNRSLFEMYLKLLTATLDAATPRAKQIIIEKMNHSSRIFFDNCLAKDASYAHQQKDEIIRLGHKLMQELDQEQEHHFTNLVSQLEQLVKSSTTKLEEIEHIDNQINITLLKNYPDLLKKYQQATAKLTEQLMEKPSDAQIKSYNLRAVESFRLAQMHLKNNENSLKKGESLGIIINHLSGWDTQYLSPPTQIYYQNVYSEIFSKLDADIKPKMTKQILSAPNKEV